MASSLVRLITICNQIVASLLTTQCVNTLWVISTKVGTAKITVAATLLLVWEV